MTNIFQNLVFLRVMIKVVDDVIQDDKSLSNSKHIQKKIKVA